jgi:hypothetical protein
VTREFSQWAAGESESTAGRYPESLLLFRRGLLWILIRRRDMDDRNRVPKFHDVIHEDFNKKCADGFEFDVAEEHDIGRVRGGIVKLELHFRFAQNGRLVGRDEPNGFVKSADARGPAVKNAEPSGDDRKLRHAQGVDHAYNEKISVGFLADFFAQKGTLQVGENSGGIHIRFYWLPAQRR